MKFRRFIIFFSYLLFWYLYFVAARIYFILFNLSEIGEASFWDLILTFFHGFRLDASMIGYIGFFVTPLFIVSAFFKSHKVLKISLNIYTGLLLAVFSLIVIGDAEVYKYWGFRLDDTPLQYLNTPAVMKASTSNWRMAFLAFLYLDLAIGMFWAYYILIGKKIKSTVNENWRSFIYIFIAGALIIPIRGGVGIVPINSGAAYFSDNMFLNHTAINVVWNSGTSLFAGEVDFSEYHYYESDELVKNFEQAFHSPDSSLKVIDKRPKKIIFIILESFTANAVNLENPKSSVTPKLVDFSKNGVLFTKCYANGDRSEKGIVSIFSSVPPLPGYSVMKDPKRSRNLPSVISSLVENGYKSAFYYGGDINFSNMNSYLKHAGFSKIVSQNNLDLDCYETKWGYHDECMFDKFYDDIVSESDTSVFALFTLSSHEPYDVPFNGPYGDKTEMQRCNNSYYYSDSCLNVFLRKFKESPEWENSLLILVSDHGTRYGGVEVWDLPKFHIYMQWTGGAVVLDSLSYTMPVGQADISASLLAQLGISHDEFIFSEDVFSKYIPNAFYAFNHGYCLIKGVRWSIFDTNADKIVYQGWDSDKLEKPVKAYAQKLAEYYDELE